MYTKFSCLVKNDLHVYLSFCLFIFLNAITSSHNNQSLYVIDK